MRCSSDRCLMKSLSALSSSTLSSVAPVVSSRYVFRFRAPSLRCAAVSCVAIQTNCRHASTVNTPTTETEHMDSHSLLQQLRCRYLHVEKEEQKGEAVAVSEKKFNVSRSPRAPPLRQIIACCEEMCQAETSLRRSADEWSETVQLLLYAMARAKREIKKKEMEGNSASPEATEAWCVALQLFLHSPPLEIEADVNESNSKEKKEKKKSGHSMDSCVSLFRCCLRHGAPVNVARAAYETLRCSVSMASECSVISNTSTSSTGGSWHVPYARFLLLSAANEKSEAVSLSLHKEALRVLLMDAAEDGEMLHPAGLLFSLELLRRLVIWREGDNEMRSKLKMNAAKPSLSSSSPSSLLRPSRMPHSSVIDDALWSRLQCSGDVVVTAARDICCRVLCNRHASLSMKRESFCRFIAVGLQLSLEELHPFIAAIPPPSDAQFTSCNKMEPQLFMKTLQCVTDLLRHGSNNNSDSDSDNAANREAVSRILSVPLAAVNSSGKATAERFVSVWLVDHIVKGLASLHREAISANAQSRSDALNSWSECSHAALQCVQRVFFHLPGGRQGPHRREHQHARQRAFCMLFQGAIDSVFHSVSTDDEFGASARGNSSDVMAIFTQVYAVHDWRWPSADVFIECMNAWRCHDMLRRVFCSVYRRDERRQWIKKKEEEENSDNNNNKTDSLSSSSSAGSWRPSLRLSTCHIVVRSSCSHDDPTTAALAVRYMLFTLLAAKSSGKCNTQLKKNDGDNNNNNNNNNESEEVEVEGGSVAMWAQLIREDIIPSVNEVFCRTGVDTMQRWMGELDVENSHLEPAAVDMTS